MQLFFIAVNFNTTTCKYGMRAKVSKNFKSICSDKLRRSL